MRMYTTIVLFCVVAQCLLYARGDFGDICDKKYSCKDCHTARLCRVEGYGNNTLVEVLTSPCPWTTPYCNPVSGTCQREVVDFSCADADSSTPCQADGFYPSPLSCSVYYVCHKGIAHKFFCNGYWYDPTSESCTARQCSYFLSFFCTGKHGSMVKNNDDDAYYAYCVGDSVKMVDKCPTGYVFNSKAQGCLPSCRNGIRKVFADAEDTGKYYVCGYKKARKHGLSHRSCAEHYRFNPVTSKCHFHNGSSEQFETKELQSNSVTAKVVSHLQKHNRI